MPSKAYTPRDVEGRIYKKWLDAIRVAPCRMGGRGTFGIGQGSNWMGRAAESVGLRP